VTFAPSLAPPLLLCLFVPVTWVLHPLSFGGTLALPGPPFPAGYFASFQRVRLPPPPAITEFRFTSPLRRFFSPVSKGLWPAEDFRGRRSTAPSVFLASPFGFSRVCSRFHPSKPQPFQLPSLEVLRVIPRGKIPYFALNL